MRPVWADGGGLDAAEREALARDLCAIDVRHGGDVSDIGY